MKKSFFENKCKPIDCIRVSIHFWILIMHYVGVFLVDYGPETRWHILFKQITIIFNIFSITFTLNGFNCGQWFAKHIHQDQKFYRLSINFYCQRLSNNLPLLYLNVITVGSFMCFIFENEIAFISFKSGFIYNIFFLNNYIEYENNVRKLN